MLGRLAPLLFVLLLSAPQAMAQGFFETFRDYQAALEADDPEEALALARQAHRLAREEGLEPHILGVTAFNAGKMELAHSNREDAKARFEESLAHFERAHGRDSEHILDPLWELGLLSIPGSPKDAARTLGRAKAIAARQTDLPGDVWVRIALDLSEAWYRDRDFMRSRRELQAVRKKLAEFEGPLLEYFSGVVAFREGRIEASRKNYRAAADTLEFAISRFEAAGTPEDREALTARGFLIEAYETMGEGEKATPHCVALGHARTGDESADYLPVYRPSPKYPVSALRAGREGEVIVELTVSADGRVKDPQVVESTSSSVFDKAALEAVRKFRYAPKIESGSPVDTPGVKYIFAFTIES